MIKLNLNLEYVTIEHIYEDGEIEKLWNDLMNLDDESFALCKVLNLPNIDTEIMYSRKRFEIEMRLMYSKKNGRK